ncbi:hypothetical protein E4U42_000922 [Claviceps africana]|uniref:Probable dipeptidyl-aminopeptidase B n=1 Tax=Claviceps africana TaxID=83212 RepID=A0A8K0J4V7_9HYPO|nr:hypothetical protein E4U42_000922 [Claviceps africana]
MMARNHVGPSAVFLAGLLNGYSRLDETDTSTPPPMTQPETSRLPRAESSVSGETERTSTVTVNDDWKTDKDDNEDEDGVCTRRTRRAQRPCFVWFVGNKRLGLLVLCLISLSGWIAAFWSMPNVYGTDTNNGGNTVIYKEPDHGAAYHASTDNAADTLAHGLSVEEIRNGSWKAVAHSLRWVENGEEVLLTDSTETTSGQVHLSTWRVIADRDGKPEAFRVDAFFSGQNGALATSHTYGGRRIVPQDIWVGANAQTGLILSDKTPEWRRSFRALYWLLDLRHNASNSSPPLQPLDPQQPSAEAQLAILSPRGDAVAFVRRGNLYLRRLAEDSVEAMTADADPAVRNGVPGWGYEEEILESNAATWWSPDGRHIAFLRTNESMVSTYTMSLYGAARGDRQYPEPLPVRYPKTGTANPVVHLRLYDTRRRRLVAVDFPGELADPERIIFSVVWLAPRQLLVKQTNRESSLLLVFLIDLNKTSPPSQTAELVRTEVGAGGCWVEPVRHAVQFVPAAANPFGPDDGYIDMVVHKGYNHLAYFTPLRSSAPRKILTSGAWEVVDAPTAVDADNGAVYFLAAGKRHMHPDERHLYRARLDGRGVHALTDDTQPAYHAASFAPGCRYAVLTYDGPGVPHSSIVALGPKNTPAETMARIEANTALAAKAERAASSSTLPQRRFHHVDLGGGGARAPIMELLPPGFDPKRRYPVLFSPYGGPGSQTVRQQFAVDMAVLLASRGYVVVTVDGRGTGFNGRDARCAVQDRLGHFEALDQIAAARLWGRRAYVDAERLAVWGWSFGGYLALKTLEMDAGRTFCAGMAVAPVTDWRLYDSLFTERHMHSPQHNPAGYAAAAITNTTALRHVRRILLAHGTADDNVHVQHTMVLLDRLVRAGVQNHDLLLFPDAAHSIRHGARGALYEGMLSWLERNLRGRDSWPGAG